MSEIYRLQYSIQVVLVSYLERGTQGGIFCWKKGENKTGLRKRPVRIHSFMSPMSVSRHPGDQVVDKIPKVLALTTACVRLLTPSLP